MSLIKKYQKLSNTIFIIVLCFMTTLISVGFSALNQNLNISGDVDFEKYSNSLYDVIRKEANLGTYAKGYVGTHHDSFTENPTYDIYYWYASNDTNGAIILDKWNVIFGGFCWQMIRTTDTGGVKLLYNGIPNEGKCNNTGTSQSIGVSKYNQYSSSPSDIGYMYKARYPYNSKTWLFKEEIFKGKTYANVHFYFGDAVTYTSGHGYSLVNPFLENGNLSELKGKYTFFSGNNEQYNPGAYYVADCMGGIIYLISLDFGRDIHDTVFTYGDSYIDNGDGTYTINNPSTIDLGNYYENSLNIVNKYLCVNATNNTCSQLRYVTAGYQYMKYMLVSHDYKYASGFVYDESTNKYILNNDSVNFWNISDSTNLQSLESHHYTCFNASGECETLSYIYKVNEENYNYISLSNGKGIEEALNEMFFDDDVNTYDSTAKTYIDNWYHDNMISYTSYLEDTIFCNGRKLSTNSGWEQYGNITNYLQFDNNSLVCTYDTDKFSVSNNKAKLTYPVGLPNYKEMNMLSNQNVNSLRNINYAYWLISPASFYNNAGYQYYVATGGYLASTNNTNGYRIRPMISLKPETEYSSGNGSKDEPYIVDTEDEGD